ncbi:MAG TPA: LemA family protein [Planctomycetota bacterium]|nr:LemA family protein [Planctomycetota bacterium]
MMLLADNPTIFILVGIAALILVWFIGTYNRILRHRNHLAESWSDIDVELKRRYDLIPNLVETVKRFARHESELFAEVARLRSDAAGNHGTPASQAVSESGMLQALRQVFVLAEGYPELKSDSMFRSLTKELALTEDRIAAARRFFNANVRDLKSLREQFPSSLVAGFLGLPAPSFFEIEDALERVVPRVGL